jgi:uncharacterized protein (TIGR03066 family)
MRLAACLFGAFALAFTAQSAPAPIPKDAPKTTAEKLVGTWEIVKVSGEKPKGAKFVVEFTKDGKMTLKVEPEEGEKMTLKGKYKMLEGDKIDYEMEQPDGGKKQEVLTIKKLADDELVTEDPDGIKEEFKRVKEKKEKKDD